MRFRLICCLSIIITGMVTALPCMCQERADSMRQIELAQQATVAMESKNWSEAASLYQRLVAVNPTSGDFWNQLGTARYSAKQYREAIPAFQQALELRSDYPFNAAYNIACCNALLGDKQAALKWLQEAMRLGFRDLSHVQTDEDLKSLHGDKQFNEIAAIVDASKLSRNEGWRFDLHLLHRELNRLHYTLREKHNQALEAAVAALDKDIPKLSDTQIAVRLMGIARLANDGHTGAFLTNAKRLPVQFFLFPSGVHIVAATPEHAALVGAYVLKIDGKPVEDAISKMEPIVSRDNKMNVVAATTRYLSIPAILNGLGIAHNTDRITLTLKDAKGAVHDIDLAANAGRPDATWITGVVSASGQKPLCLRNQYTPYWFEYLPEAKAIYFQYNEVRDVPSETFEAFCTRLFKRVAENDVERLILDIRWNGGGNTFLTRPLIHGLIQSAKLRKRGNLFVITGRNTFSAAQNCTTMIERNMNAIFVGEPTGSSPNFVGETIRVDLPYSKMRATVSDLYWQSSWPMDYRTWIAPDIYAPPTIEAFREGRDPALDAILAWKG